MHRVGSTSMPTVNQSRPLKTTSMRLRHGTYDLEVHKTKVVLISPVQHVDGILGHDDFRKLVLMAETNLFSALTFHSQTNEIFRSHRPIGVSVRNPMRIIVTSRYGSGANVFSVEAEPKKLISFLRRGITLLDLVQVEDVMTT